MTTPTPEQITRARRIAAHTLCSGEKWQRGVKAGMYEDIMAGMADDEPLVQTALAAIIETEARVTERAARLAYRICAETRHVTLGDKIAAALRSGEHMKGEG